MTHRTMASIVERSDAAPGVPHPGALAELRRIHGLWQIRFAAHRRYMATRADPVGVYDRAVIEAEVRRLEALRTGNSERGSSDPAT
jgi:hypothetical protein